MVDRDATFGRQLLTITERQAVVQVPAHHQHDDLTEDAEPSEAEPRRKYSTVATRQLTLLTLPSITATVPVQCALPVAIRIPLPDEHRDYPSPPRGLAGRGRRETAGGVCRRVWRVDCWRTDCLRFSPHGSPSLPVAGWLTRWSCPHGGVLARGTVSSWSWWSGEHRRRIRPGSEEVVSPGAGDVVRVSPGVRDVGVESLATELVIDRRRVHGVTP